MRLRRARNRDRPWRIREADVTSRCWSWRSLTVRPGRDARIGAIASATSPGKTNVPPFRGGTYGHSMRAAITVNRSQGPPHALPAGLRCRGKIQLQCLTHRTCGRAHADSCARVTPYCSFWAVGYDISCGGSDPLSRQCQAYTFGRAFRARRGLRDSARRDFERIGIAALSPIGRRDAKGRVR